MRFVKIPNSIFKKNLSANAFRVYAYLQARANVLHTATVSYELIAQACGISPKTAYNAVSELVLKKLVYKEHRYGTIGYAKNKYSVEQLPGGWFKVACDILCSPIKSTDFVVYCYIMKCADAKALEAFPSLSAISEGTGISRSRVAQAVKYLRQYTYLNHVRRHYKRTRAYRHNRYLQFRLFDKKRRMRPHKHILQSKEFGHFISRIFNSIIKRGVENVKSFFIAWGSIIFTKQLIDPQNSTIKKK